MKTKFANNGLILTACMALLGCDTPVNNSGLKHNFYYQEICVDGVIYLRSPNGNLTPKVNADFYPITCVIKEKNNG